MEGHPGLLRRSAVLAPAQELEGLSLPRGESCQGDGHALPRHLRGQKSVLLGEDGDDAPVRLGGDGQLLGVRGVALLHRQVQLSGQGGKDDGQDHNRQKCRQNQKDEAAGDNFAFHTESLLFGLLRQRTSIGTPRRVSEGCSDDLPSMEPGEFSSCCAFSIAGENTFVKLLNLVYNTAKICTFEGAAVERSA